MPFRFVHTGDEHIDNDTHGSLDPTTGMNRAWLSNYACLRAIADAAAREGVDAFIHAGDATKHGRPTTEALMLYVDAMAPVVAAGIPVILLGGNHELLQVSSSHRTPTAVLGEMLSGQGADVHVYERAPGLLTLPSGAQIACVPWLSKTWVLTQTGQTDLNPADGDHAVIDYALAHLTAITDAADAAAPLILASHMTVSDVRIDNLAKGNRRGSETDLTSLFAEPVIPRSDLEAFPFSYVGLSHVHARQRVGDHCFYAGSPNRLTFTDAGDPKSANLVTVGDTNTLASVDYIDTPARDLADIHLSDASHPDAIARLTPDSLVRIVLPAGERDMPPSIADAIRSTGATVVEVKAKPAPVQRRTVTVLPERIDPQAALRTWLAEKTPDCDTTDVLAKAAAIAAEVAS